VVQSSSFFWLWRRPVITIWVTLVAVCIWLEWGKCVDAFKTKKELWSCIAVNAYLHAKDCGYLLEFAKMSLLVFIGGAVLGPHIVACGKAFASLPGTGDEQ
jgi:hypothetical protein